MLRTQTELFDIGFGLSWYCGGKHTEDSSVTVGVFQQPWYHLVCTQFSDDVRVPRAVLTHASFVIMTCLQLHFSTGVPIKQLPLGSDIYELACTVGFSILLLSVMT